MTNERKVLRNSKGEYVGEVIREKQPKPADKFEPEFDRINHGPFQHPTTK